MLGHAARACTDKTLISFRQVPDMNTPAAGFHLERLRIDPSTGEVAGPGGVEKLDPKVMSVLVLMAGADGRVVSREELLSRLWPGAVVTDDALTRCFYELRRHLARAGGDEGYRSLVETLPKRGYRLNGRIGTAPEAAGAEAPPRTRRRALPAVLAVAAVAALALLAASRFLPWTGETQRPEPVAIAVLPFVDMSEGHDHGYFSDGIAEEILNRLAQASNLRVIARTSSFAFRDAPVEIPEIASRLGVDYVLEGSVRRSANRVRVTAQLIDAGTNSHVWSDTFDGSLENLFAVQDEIARTVATSLEVVLTGDRRRAGAPASFAAYESYLHGQFLHHRRSPGDVERSIEQFEEAVKRDPGFARAWAALAGACALMVRKEGAAGLEWRVRQGEAARKAVELDPELAVAQARLAQYYAQLNETEKSREHFRRARALDPDDLLVLGFSASKASLQGDPEQSVEIWRRIVAKDPLSPISRGNLANFLLRTGRLDEALAEFRRMQELNPTSEPDVKAQTAVVLILSGRYDEADTLIAELPEGGYRDFALSLLHGVPGRGAEAEAALARLASAPGSPRNRLALAEAYAFRGRSDEAFTLLEELRAQLERDFQTLPHGLWSFLEEVRVSYLLVPLHQDRRWQALVALPPPGPGARSGNE